MRTLTTFVVAAALIGGISLASAQTSQSQNAPVGAPNQTMNGQAMSKVMGKSKFCLETSPGGALNCKYASMTACQRAGKAGNKQCFANPKMGTTGQR